LGGTVDAFTARFGTPSINNGAEWNYDRTCGDGTDWCESVLPSNGLDSQWYVALITLTAHDSNPWDLTTARGICEDYMPPDAKFVQQLTYPFGDTSPSGIVRVYMSETLAQIFSADQFNDSANKPVAPGTFDITYLYQSPSSTSTFGDCQISLGEQ
jgi:hypothetical protein